MNKNIILNLFLFEIYIVGFCLKIKLDDIFKKLWEGY